MRGHFGIRLAAYLIDALLLALPAGAIAAGDVGTGAPNPLVGAVGLVLVAAAIAYFTLLEGGTRGATAGKRAMGLRVVAANGGRLGYGRALARTLLRAVSAFPLYAGFLWCLVDAQGRTWHDLLAGSRVVRRHAAER